MDDTMGSSGGVSRKARRRNNPKKLAPIDGLDSSGAPVKTRKSFQKKDLIEAVRRLTPASASTSNVSLLAQKSANITASQKTAAPPAGPEMGSQEKTMEWGVNMNARRFNELKTLADRKADELKAKLDTLASLKMEHDSLDKMMTRKAPESIRIAELLGEIQATNDETDRKLHYRRQLEHMYRRLQSNGIKFDAHINQMEDALAASEREYKDVKILMRQLEAGKTTALHELHELQRQVDIERGDRERVFLVRQTEANNAKKMEVWRKEREIMRKEFASELKGDLSLEEEQALKQKLTHHQRLTEDLRAQNEQLQRDASELEHAFTQIRQATGVNSLDEMVEKFVGQEGNRKALQTEKAEAEARLTNAKHAKEETEARFTELKASGIGSTEMNREIADKLEGEITAAKHELKVSKAACERLEAVLVALRQGVVGLYQRLRPFANLLEGEGGLPSSTSLPSMNNHGAGGPGAGGHGPARGGVVSAASAPVDVSQIDSLDAVHLSEIVLSKMVELIGGGDVGGGAGGAKFGAVAEAEVAKEDEAFGDPLDVTDGLPNPRNNIRVKNGKELRLAEDTMAQFALEADGESSVRGGGAEHDAAEAHEPPPDDPLAVVEDMVLTRDFLKLSSSRQHSEKLRSMEQDSRRRKLMERMETADESERQLMQGRAARKRAQGEANKRLSSAPSHASTNKPLSVKESAVERAQMFLTAVPDLA